MKTSVGPRREIMRKRELEAQTLLEALPAIKQHFQEEEIVVLGDTNCKERSEEAIQALVTTEFEDLNADDIPSIFGATRHPSTEFSSTKHASRFCTADNISCDRRALWKMTVSF